MTQVLARRVQALLAADGKGSMFRCSECGSFLDTPRINPETGGIARKCMSCLDWYPVAALRSRLAR